MTDRGTAVHGKYATRVSRLHANSNSRNCCPGPGPSTAKADPESPTGSAAAPRQAVRNAEVSSVSPNGSGRASSAPKGTRCSDW